MGRLPDNLTREDCIKALALIDEKGYPPKHKSKDFDLLYNGGKYPPKVVIAYANIIAKNTNEFNTEFQGGETGANKLLKELGFEIVNKLNDYDKELIVKLIPLYKSYIKNPKYDEIYKWESIKIFQNNWDIYASNFREMFNKSFPGNNNLYMSGNYFPISMMDSFILLNENKARGMFMELYNEDLDILDRIRNFIKNSDDLLKSLNKPELRLHFQDTRSISVYLAFKYPDKYYLFKITEIKYFGDTIKWKPQLIQGRIENLPSYYLMADDVKYVLLEDKDLLEEHKSRLTDKCYPDNSFNILTQDFIWISAKYLIKSLSENNATTSIEIPKFAHSLNTILYGPPGTGKTFKTKEVAVKIIEGNN